MHTNTATKASVSQSVHRELFLLKIWVKQTVLRRRFSALDVLITAVGIILFWRGAWALMDAYLLPQYPVLSYVISIIAGIVLLMSDDLRINELK